MSAVLWLATLLTGDNRAIPALSVGTGASREPLLAILLAEDTPQAKVKRETVEVIAK